jgi:hypothetical protein
MSMQTDPRFVVRNEQLIDTLNSTDDLGGWYYWNGDPGNESRLRERAFYMRLGKLIKKLTLSDFEGSTGIGWPISKIVRASQLNAFDLAISAQHRFIGSRASLNREKKGMSDYTSLRLFVDDVECLLRDIYGDTESEALELIRAAVFVTVHCLNQHARPDLWKEQQDAWDFDYMFGIGVPEDCATSRSDWRRGMLAKAALMRRARNVLMNPSSFSEYTVEFAKRFSEDWDCSFEAEQTALNSKVLQNKVK